MENAVLERRSKELYRITKKVVQYCEESPDLDTLLNLAQAVGNADALAYLFPEREFCALSAEAHEKLNNALRNFRNIAIQRSSALADVNESCERGARA